MQKATLVVPCCGGGCILGGLVVDVFAIDFEGLDMDIDDGVFSESGP